MKFLNRKKIMLMLTLSTLIFVSCVDIPNDVILPEWDIELNVPLINRVYTLDEIIKTQEHILIDTTNNIFLLQSGKYFLNSSLSEFVQINEASSLEDVPTITSVSDSFTVYVQFPEGLQVDSGEFASGLLNLNVDNPSSENVSIILRLPAFHNSQGEVITIQTDIAAGQTNSESFNLNGYKYEIPPDQPLGLRNSFKLVVRAQSNQPGNIVYTDLSLSDLSFNYVTGLLPSRSLGNKISAYDFDVADVAEYRDRSFLRDATLNLKADYISMFNAPNLLEVKNLNIIAKRNDGTELYLKDKVNNPYFTFRMTNGSLNTVFNESNSNITDFISFFPDSVILRAEYIINPDNSSGTFSNLDSLRFETDFSTRSFLALRTTTMEDESEIIISEIDREDIRGGKAADIKFEIENGIPLLAWVKVDLHDENNNYLFTLTKNLAEGDSISFGAAFVNGNGEVIGTNILPVKNIILDESQIQLFSRAHYIKYRVSFSTTGANSNPPQIIAIRPSDFVKIKTYGKVKYKISSDD
ncbi:MAG TPA: hypothetical protein VLN45_10685 [Ignavibacteriaceae bacterium]|nr:hypothetical protein [Ignavibacteriaceae bacterium]